MLSIPKYPEQYAQHFPAIFYLLCCAFQHHVVVPRLAVVPFAVDGESTAVGVLDGAGGKGGDKEGV